MSILLKLSCLACLLPAMVMAQETLSLSQAEMERLNLVFAGIEMADSSSGNIFPARVINPPASMSQVTVLHEGIVSAWLVDSGQQVEAGTALVTIRSPEMRHLQGEWLEASLALEQAEFELEKDRRLYDEGVISRQRLNATSRQYQSAGFRLQAATDTLNMAGFDDSALQQAEPFADSLGLYTLRAHSAGTVNHRALLEGQLAPAGTVIASIQPQGALWLSARLPARQAPAVSIGQRLVVSEPGVQVTVRQKDLELDHADQTFELLAEFSQAVSLLPGSIVSLVLPAGGEGVKIPASAVVHNGEQTVVYVRVAGGVQARELNLIPSGSTYIATTGIVAGEMIVVQGASILKGIQLGLGGD